MVTQAAIGFDQKKPPSRTAVVALVISKGFDSVDHTILLQQISDSALHSNLVRWLAVYFHGHSAACIYQSARFCIDDHPLLDTSRRSVIAGHLQPLRLRQT
jgi:hypothetical protein